MRWVTSAGFVVGEVFELEFFLQVAAAHSSGETLDQLLKEFVKYREGSLRTILKEDEQLFPIDSKHIFTKCLAVCVVGGGVPMSDLSELYQLAPSDLPWTLLKVKNRTLMAVSPQAKAAMQTFVRTNQDLAKQLLYLIDAGRHRSSGSTRGALFEEFFFQALPGMIIVLKRHGCIDEIVNLKIVSPAVDEVKGSNLGDFLPETNYCYYTPNMRDVDIILNVDDKIFLIQCSISREIGVKKGFWRTVENRKLTAVLAGPSHVKKHLEDSNSQLANKYKQNKFAFVLSNDVLGDDFVNLLTYVQDNDR
ncbi:Hypothetical predicted protein [Paramuricea clavata]|uniref:Uncharacterized protein n=1 Tax=Paramuricea clavata TaxID=317549 RepID=A0A7D9EIV7_PARCT|nr:Hypothetical predicted protein [Paramuricea clavata]